MLIYVAEKLNIFFIYFKTKPSMGGWKIDFKLKKCGKYEIKQNINFFLVSTSW